MTSVTSFLRALLHAAALSPHLRRHYVSNVITSILLANEPERVSVVRTFVGEMLLCLQKLEDPDVVVIQRNTESSIDYAERLADDCSAGPILQSVPAKSSSKVVPDPRR